jgi:excisionase family DNA binding protein
MIRSRTLKKVNNQSKPNDDLLTALEISKMLRCSRDTIYLLIKEEDLPAIRLRESKSTYRVRRSDFSQWLEKRHRQSKEAQALRALQKKELQPA